MQGFRILILSASIAAVAGCGDDGVADEGTRAPPLNQMVETPGDWSLLNVLVDRPTAESELLLQSPITVDLNAMLGPNVFTYRKAMDPAGPLVREGKLLVSVTPQGPNAAYIVIDPVQRAIEAGWREGGRWHVERTAAAEIDRPPQVKALLAS